MAPGSPGSAVPRRLPVQPFQLLLKAWGTMILLDYRDKRPIYEQVVEKLERLIVSGGLEPLTRMPSVRSLAMELSLNPNTIQRAYAQPPAPAASAPATPAEACPAYSPATHFPPSHNCPALR